VHYKAEGLQSLGLSVLCDFRKPFKELYPAPLRSRLRHVWDVCDIRKSNRLRG